MTEPIVEGPEPTAGVPAAVQPTLPQVAQKRGVQAFLQGLGIDVAVGVCLLVIANVSALDSREGLILFGVSVGKTVLITGAQYVVRRFVDRSGFNRDGTPVAT